MTLKGTAVETEYGSGLRAGDFFFLSAVDAAEEDGSSVCRHNRERILFCLKKLQDVLTAADGSLDCLVQLRFYTADDTAMTKQEVLDVLSEVIIEPLPAVSVIPGGKVPGGLMADGTAVILSDGYG
jgi:enamine deaminase RidA (YjgF/YER057c/UK114 family)